MAAGAVIGAIDAAINIGQKLFGGGGGPGVCPGQTPTDTASRVLLAATPAELGELARLITATNASWFNGSTASLQADPATMAYQIAGGSDCKATSTAGKALQQYWSTLVARYGSARSPIDLYIPPDPRESAAGGSIFTGARPQPGGGLAIPTTGTSSPSAGGGTVTDAGRRLLEEIFRGSSLPQTVPAYPAPATPAGAASSSPLLLYGGAALVLVLVLFLILRK